MRAVRVEEFGGPEVLVAVDVPDPVAGPGQVLLRVAAAGVNRADALIRAGRYHRAGRPPLTPGLEAAGTVLAVGEGVTGFRPGQRVMAMAESDNPGFYAELAAVSAQKVVALPDGVDPVAAAGLPVAWLSAWYSLNHLARLAKGETVVVQAAASGVGSAAVQIAAEAGARVVAVARTADKTEWAASLGAHETVDTSAFEGDAVVDEVLRLTGGQGADVVLDTVGGDTFGYSLRQAGFAGRVVALANVALAPSTIDTRHFYPKNVDALLGLGQMYQVTGELDKLREIERRATTQHPQDAKVWAWVAVRQAQTKNWTEAAQSYHQAVKLDPENRVYRIHLGFTLARAGRYDEGYEWLSRSMREADARYNLAQMMIHNGDVDKARMELRLCLKADPKLKAAEDELASLANKSPTPAPLPALPQSN